MATANPTGAGAAVALTIPSEDRRFLRGVFTDAREGVRRDLTDYPDQLRDPARLRREEATYNSLLAALNSGSIVPDPATRDALCSLAKVIDAANEYDRVIAEHAALLGLSEQLSEGDK